MHSKIYQLTRERVNKENWLNEETLAQGDGSMIDYCDNVTDEERKELIGCLVNDLLPKGMFTLLDDDTLLFNGGTEEWKAEWVRRIQDKANKITTENVTTWIGETYFLEKELKNPLGIATLFYTDEEGTQSYAVQSGEFMSEVVCNLKEGELLYVGGVVDYHY